MNGLILTTSGAAEIEAAYQNGQTVTVRHVLLGDGGGRALPSTPDEMAAMTSLYGEFGQEPFSDGAVAQLTVKCYLRGWKISSPTHLHQKTQQQQASKFGRSCKAVNGGI